MKLRTMVTTGAILAALLGTLPAHAVDELCTVDSGSASTTQIDDVTDDSGLLGGTGTNAAVGDPTDLVGGWFSRDAAGVVNVNFTVAQLTGTEADFVYYFRWTFAGDSPANADRFIRVQPRPYGASFAYGYFDTAAGSYTSVGGTTGTVTPGTPGLITAIVPLDKMGTPGPGDVLEAPALESKVRAGSPGVPPGAPAPPATPGYVFAMDDTTNGAGCETVMV